MGAVILQVSEVQCPPRLPGCRHTRRPLKARAMTAPHSRSLELNLDLPDVAATAALAQAVSGHARRGDVVALFGDLGTGKTTFARAFIDALSHGPVETVPSPTFTLVQVYERAPAPVWHFDLYRLEQPEEVYELGFEDALAQGICLIEWPERLGPLLPRDRLDVGLAFATNPDARRAELRGHGTWAARCGDLAP
jgi:tRNA threonylcarbamoyladenosine biosynthesis protein TsaE